MDSHRGSKQTSSEFYIEDFLLHMISATYEQRKSRSGRPAYETFAQIPLQVHQLSPSQVEINHRC